MIDELKLIGGGDIEVGGNDGKVSDRIKIHHPTLGEIRDMGEGKYYGLVSTICATPSDYKSILWDNFEIDYEKVGDFEFFIMLWSSLKDTDLTIVLPDIRAVDFVPVQNTETKEILLYNQNNNTSITESVYIELSDYIRKFHGFEKRVDVAGNETTKKYLIDKARKELNRGSKKKTSSVLAPLVSAMVNCEQFKYDHKTVWDLNIYQFMDSVKRIQKIKSVDKTLNGIYAGNVDQKKISKDALNWLGTLD